VSVDDDDDDVKGKRTRRGLRVGRRNAGDGEEEERKRRRRQAVDDRLIDMPCAVRAVREGAVWHSAYDTQGVIG